MALAERFGGEIINADALQVYRGLDIGTAKPTEDEQRRVRHHLIDVLEPTEVFSAGDFSRRARSAIEEVQSRGAFPIVVGGSGLYLRALFDGIAPLPSSVPEVRIEFEQALEREGSPALWQRLAKIDPPTAERLGPNDSQRILRALEIHALSGRPMSELLAEDPVGHGRLDADRVGLTLERSFLYDRIATRVHQMMECGWVDEVRGLLDAGLDEAAPAFQAIGYRQIAAHVGGRLSLEDAIEETVRATRRFAKRQLSWFRKESEIKWFPAVPHEVCLQQVLDSFFSSD